MPDKNNAFPDLLSGPILRKLEASQINLWLVTSKPFHIRLLIDNAYLTPKVRNIQACDNLCFVLIEGLPDTPFPVDEWVNYTI